MTINSQCFEITEKHKRLVICLLKGITQKNDIINIVWYEQAGMVSDNNYHQLIHKFRNLLLENNLPKAMLRTIPRHGAMLDLSLLPKIEETVQPITISQAKKTFTLAALGACFTAALSMVTKSLYR
ncbi:transcriptional regulator [Rouxiella sp. WC2420]|uniref:Transcriptional regulator n=1 Tax=Rouxiella sp. WC2420 TaxID=3234145 RepID=A0AB39VUR0_9GAMM